jgi:predicted NUDIX family NTP pyrophosphohydrolase
MTKKSAGILLYRYKKEIEFLLVHPGGPFFSKKDDGTWSIPKGEFDDTENARDAALREFKEETGIDIDGETLDLTPVKLKSGKVVFAFAIEKDIDVQQIKSNTFEIEWPPRSGKKKEFPEIDKGEWFNYETAKVKINSAQVSLIDELIEYLRT